MLAFEVLATRLWLNDEVPGEVEMCRLGPALLERRLVGLGKSPSFPGGWSAPPTAVFLNLGVLCGISTFRTSLPLSWQITEAAKQLWPLRPASKTPGK